MKTCDKEVKVFKCKVLDKSFDSIDDLVKARLDEIKTLRIKYEAALAVIRNIERMPIDSMHVRQFKDKYPEEFK